MNWIDKEYHEQKLVVQPWMKPALNRSRPPCPKCDAYCWLAGCSILAALAWCCFSINP